ncbi:hypothetical protein LDG_5609 [Legionella drancourtii LLAP12]|uniref:Uncharacterized protein n=1 Tax=Legionella drancourtii LLAP12 TaxID=658187 RepID=G9EK85_9GAMM|nr:hypothetical protein LDG_5609 [Legionella drancourtii LLAP12]
MDLSLSGRLSLIKSVIPTLNSVAVLTSMRAELLSISRFAKGHRLSAMTID